MDIYRDSHDWRHSSPNPEYRFNNDVPNRLLEETRLSILNWNPGLRRGKEGAIEKHIAVKWFNKDTFHPDINFSSIDFHDTRNGQHQIVNEGQSGWVLQAVISRASFRRLSRNGKSFFTMMSLHINNHFPEKRGIGKKLLLTVCTVMLQEQIDMVAGDFNGSAWPRQSDSDPRPIGIIEEVFANTNLPVPPGPTPLW